MNNVVGGVERCGEIEKTRLIYASLLHRLLRMKQKIPEIKFWKIANQFVTVISLLKIT